MAPLQVATKCKKAACDVIPGPASAFESNVNDTIFDAKLISFLCGDNKPFLIFAC